MIRFAADEDFHRPFLFALARLDVPIEVVRVRDVGLGGSRDEVVMEWAASENRVLLSHDRNTMIQAAHDRIVAGLAMPGLIIVEQHIEVALFVEQLELIANCQDTDDLANQVLFIPMHETP
jgi:hypothetical protein